MTEFEWYDDWEKAYVKVAKVQIVSLGENLVNFKLTLENQKIVDVGYLRMES